MRTACYRLRPPAPQARVIADAHTRPATRVIVPCGGPLVGVPEEVRPSCPSCPFLKGEAPRPRLEAKGDSFSHARV